MYPLQKYQGELRKSFENRPYLSTVKAVYQCIYVENNNVFSVNGHIIIPRG